MYHVSFVKTFHGTSVPKLTAVCSTKLELGFDQLSFFIQNIPQNELNGFVLVVYLIFCTAVELPLLTLLRTSVLVVSFFLYQQSWYICQCITFVWFIYDKSGLNSKVSKLCSFYLHIPLYCRATCKPHVKLILIR